ncbi:hypothetical protein [Blastococcus mobilis]|uniref:Uncharacterized protein n=1 Tax=Blastococcus mobilis TaxID=1938746 RepID=A0A238VWI1_9ACTN|nr:hypothetical protein [Blastococcus mobilis]SNR38660.1 hypothetical protein SAMN06272737_105109 [Blastococcus mobilis]
MPRPDIRVQIMRDGTGNAIRMTDEAVTLLVAEATAAVEGFAKIELDELVYSQPPAPSGYVRTGHLLNSVGHRLTGPTEGEVFASAEYAVHVHEGSVHNTPAKPFLVNALRREKRRTPARARRIARQLGLTQ